jgi:hypothetical protein
MSNAQTMQVGVNIRPDYLEAFQKETRTFDKKAAVIDIDVSDWLFEEPAFSIAKEVNSNHKVKSFIVIEVPFPYEKTDVETALRQKMADDEAKWQRLQTYRKEMARYLQSPQMFDSREALRAAVQEAQFTIDALFHDLWADYSEKGMNCVKFEFFNLKEIHIHARLEGQAEALESKFGIRWQVSPAVIEAEKAAAEEKRRQEAADGAAREAAEKEECLAWISEHGSKELKTMLDRGYPYKRQYVTERVTALFNWLDDRRIIRIDWNDGGSAADKASPSSEALDLETRARDSLGVGTVRIVFGWPFWTDSDPQVYADQTAQEMLRIWDLFPGCPDVYLTIR